MKIQQIEKAEVEFNRLHSSVAWSPLHNAKRHRVNQYLTRYRFDDGSQLSVYTNGDAGIIRSNGDIKVARRWHHCNAQGGKQ